MKLLVKLGGTLLDSDLSRQRLAREVAALATAHQVVVVHGGGKQMTRYLEERGVRSRFVNGLRVTTPDVLDAVLKVVAGSVNRELVAALVGAGARAVGLSGIDACLTEAEPMHPDLGAVGRPVRANPELLDVLAGHGFLPVVACVAGDRQGRIYNVNADQMAAACAAAFRADRLFFLTDVDGVRNAKDVILPVLNVFQSQRLIQDGIATGGMQAKLTAAAQALGDGVGEVVVAPGSREGILARLVAGEIVGTRLMEAAGG